MEFFLNSGEGVAIQDGALQEEKMLGLMAEVLGRIHSLGRTQINEEVAFPMNVGKDYCVATTRHDEIVFAQRIGKNGVSRFVKGREPENTSYVTVRLKLNPPRNYVLVLAYFGKMRAPEIWEEPASFLYSRRFWMSHAYTWGSFPIVPGSQTKFNSW